MSNASPRGFYIKSTPVSHSVLKCSAEYTALFFTPLCVCGGDEDNLLKVHTLNIAFSSAV